MKKKLEAELISIAHRILKMKNRSELVQLHKEVQNLYEKLAVMIFVEDNFSALKPTIGHAEVVDQMEQIFGAERKEETNDSKPEAEVENPTEVEAKVSTEEKSDDNKSDEVIEESQEEIVPAEAKSEEVEVIKEDDVAENQKDSEAEVTENDDQESSDDMKDFEPETLLKAEDKPENNVQSQSEETTSEDNADQKNNVDASQKESNFTPENIDHHGLDHRSSVEFDRKFSESEKSETDIAAESNTQNPTVSAVENSEKQNDSLNQSFSFQPQFQPEKPKTDHSRSGQLPLDDLYGTDYKDPEFIKPEELAKEQAAPRENVIPISRPADNSNVFTIRKDDPKSPLSLNDRLSKGITIGLNDRIAFMKHLFKNSSEDYNRVLSQLITFDNYPDALDFINNMVKPDYNNWEGKDDYSQRFMEIVERKFN